MLDLTDTPCRPDAVYMGPQGNLRAERAQLLTRHGTRMQVYLDVGGVSSRRGRVCRRRGTKDFSGGESRGETEAKEKNFSQGREVKIFKRGEKLLTRGETAP